MIFLEKFWRHSINSDMTHAKVFFFFFCHSGAGEITGRCSCPDVCQKMRHSLIDLAVCWQYFALQDHSTLTLLISETSSQSLYIS